MSSIKPNAIHVDDKLQPLHTQWYYTDNNKKTCGPVDIFQLYTLFQTNVIKQNTFIWNPKFIRIWSPLRSVTKLYTLFQTEHIHSNSLANHLDEALSDMHINALYSPIAPAHPKTKSDNIQLYARTIMPDNSKQLSHKSTKSAQYFLLQNRDEPKSPITPDTSPNHPHSWTVSEASDERTATKITTCKKKQIITEDESKAINDLHKRYTKTNTMIKIFENGMNAIDNECNKANDEIHDRFDELIRKILKEKDLLLRDVEDIKTTKKDMLNQQIQCFKTHRNDILHTKKKYDDNLTHITDIKQRRATNITLCSNVLAHKVFSKHGKNKTKMNVIPFIDVMFDATNDDAFIHNIVQMDEHHRPSIPKMSIRTIDSDYAILEWTVHCEAIQRNNTINGYIPYERYNITEFEIQIAQMSPINDADEEKEYSASQTKHKQYILEWQTVAMITNDEHKKAPHRWSYTLRNLYKNKEYFVRIQSWNELGGNSTFGQAIRFETLCRKQQEKLEWCLEPFSLNKHDLNMNGLRLYPNGQNNRIQIVNKSFCKLIVNYNVATWPYNKFIWCFELHVISNCSWLGFIENPVHQNVSSWNNWLGNETYDYSIGINSVNRQCFPYSKAKSIGAVNLLKIPKPNDKIYFIIDLVKSKCRIYHNEYNLGVLFTNIPVDIVPAISNGEEPMDCTVQFRTAL
eukprot:8409_1